MADPNDDDTGADSDVEQLKSANAVELHKAVREEGEDELDRPAVALLWSGFAGGVAITASLILEAALRMHLPDTGWRELVTALGYPAGFLIVVLGRLQFFTESTITAMLPLATGWSWRALQRTLRLWGLVLGANMVGAAAAAGAIATGLLGIARGGSLAHEMVAVSRTVVEFGPWDTLVNAVPAGFLVAAIAWTLPNARNQSFLVIFAFTYMIGVAGFSHSIVGSVEAFLLLWSGEIDALRCAGIIGAAVVGNLIGGAGLFALLAHAQVRSDVSDERAD